MHKSITLIKLHPLILLMHLMVFILMIKLENIMSTMLFYKLLIKGNCLQHAIYFYLVCLVGLVIGINSILYQVASILGSHPDLKEQCDDFIIYVEKTGKKHVLLFHVCSLKLYILC